MALHLSRLFDGAGFRVILADTPAHPLSAASRSCASYVRLPPPRFAPASYASALEALVAREKPVLVVPTCEEIFYLAAAWKERGLLPELFAPDFDLLREVHDKHAFIALCQRLGLEVPRTVKLESRADLDAVRAHASKLVFKPVWSRFANHVRICPSLGELATITPTARAPWVAQEYLEGEELSAYALARHGRLLAHSLYRSPYRAGKGAGIYFEPVEDRAVLTFVTAFVAATQWTGQISFDLMRLSNGRVMPLECNPRATSGLHFFRDPARFVGAMCGDGPPVDRDIVRPQTVRLAMAVYGLPHALRSNTLPQFRRDLQAADDLLDWPGDPAPKRAQWRALAEVLGLSIRHGISLQRASTRDIEWDGPDQSSI